MGIGFALMILIWILFILISAYFFIYSIKKKKIFGVIISSVCFLFLVSFYFINDIEEVNLSKDDVKNDLRFLKVNLKDDFEIISNEVSGMPKRSQETEIIISTMDSERILNEIKNAKNFKILDIDREGVLIIEPNKSYDKDGILNYKYPDFYSKELFEITNVPPTRFHLYIKEKNDTLKYQKFEV